ncbi:2-methylaconitate cis-trans isomerase PrpF family protein [Chitinimonas sp. PSY-7]|uniref:PrpF domain-containing protein n=1 Tax=Chitinimonas sp. PSY-7 TaxID=3459088 RepID=UPI004040045F
MLLRRIHATLLRGGTSKGVFFLTDHLPSDPSVRDRLLARLIGSPDPYGRQIDGLGTGISSTSKVVLLSKSSRPDCDVDYLFGHVAIESGLIDWSGSCGNLSAAVGPAAILDGLVKAPRDGEASVRIWQANTGKRILARVPMCDGVPAQSGSYHLDGVAFNGVPIQLDFLDPAGSASGGLFPTGQACDSLDIPSLGPLPATLIDAANPLVIIRAEDLGLTGLEMPVELNADEVMLAKLELIRQYGSVRMGLATTLAEAAARPATPKLAWIALPKDYLALDGNTVQARQIDLMARTVSMGKLHAGFTGTGTIALGAAAAMPGTLVSTLIDGPLIGRALQFGHPSGINEIELVLEAGQIQAARMTRTARVLMRGEVWLPD